jgi:hypothetical protein
VAANNQAKSIPSNEEVNRKRPRNENEVEMVETAEKETQISN